MTFRSHIFRSYGNLASMNYRLLPVFLLTVLNVLFAPRDVNSEEWKRTDLPKQTTQLPAELRETSGDNLWLRAYVKVPTGWTEAAGPNVITQSISVLVPDTFPHAKWWVNGQALGTPIQLDAAENTTQKVTYHRLAVPYGVLKRDQLVQIDVSIDVPQMKSRPTIAAPAIAAYHEEAILAGNWLFRFQPITQPVAIETQPDAYTVFEKVTPGTAPLAAPTTLQPTRNLSPAESLAAMQVTEGLVVDQVLSEPDIGQPVGMAFDSAGRLWIAEYRQYPYPAGMKIVSRDKFYRAVYDIFPQPPPTGPAGKDRISVHEDTDGDGKFDKHHSFVDGLNIASSMLPTADGVWVLNPPYLLFYNDDNHDLKADGSPEVHLTGFGMEDTHSVANSLRLGPDGWIYGAMGSTVSSSITVTGVNQPPLQCEGAAIWRYHPATKRYEIFAEGGGNAFCVTFDSEGRLYSGHNGNDTRGFHYWQGAYYRKDEFKHGVVSNPYAYGFLGYMQHPPTPRFSHALVRYNDTQLPERFREQLLSVDPLKGTVVLSKMTRRGGTFATEDMENSLSGKDFAFRPVDIQVGPDGNVYVADLCEEFIAHGQHYLGMLNPETGRIYRLRSASAKPRLLQANRALSELSLSDKLEMLKSPSLAQRAIVREQLVATAEQDNQKLIELLRSNLRSDITFSSLESLWILTRLAAMNDSDWQAALAHPRSEVRMWAVRLIGDWPETAGRYATQLQKLATQESAPEVLCQLACTAKRLNAQDGIALARALGNKSHMNEEVNFPLLMWWAIEPHLTTGRTALMEWLGEKETWKSPLMVATVGERIVRKLLSTQSRKDASDVGKMIRAALEVDPKATSGLLRGFDQGIANRVSLDLPNDLIESVLAAGGGSLSLRLRLGDEKALADALKLIGDAQTPLSERRSLIQTVGLIRSAKALPELKGLIGGKVANELQIDSLYALESIAPPAELISLIEIYAQLPPEVQQSLLRVLARREITATALLEAISMGKISQQSISTEIRDLLASHPGDKWQEQLATLLPEGKPLNDEETRLELKRWGDRLQNSGGDPYQGKTLFAEHCGKCHKLFNEGGEVGPDLTRYNRDDRTTLLLSILRPSQEIREGFQTFQALTADGRIITGFVVDQNDEVVTLREAGGQSVTLPRDEIEDMKATPKSVMPEGLLEKLSEQQVLDLFAYLQSGQPLGR